MYSRVGYNLRKPKNVNKNKAFPHRKSSILDDFEAIANESHEEILNRDSKLQGSVKLSPRKQRLELQSINHSPSVHAPERDDKVGASAPVFKDVLQKQR